MVSPSGLVNRLIKLRDETLMVHFTCDLCGKDLTTCTDGRFVVKIEAYPGFDPTEIKDDDLADDPMEAAIPIWKSLCP